MKQLLLNTGGLDPETGKPLLETLDFQINGQTHVQQSKYGRRRPIDEILCGPF